MTADLPIYVSFLNSYYLLRDLNSFSVCSDVPVVVGGESSSLESTEGSGSPSLESTESSDSTGWIVGSVMGVAMVIACVGVGTDS